MYLTCTISEPNAIRECTAADLPGLPVTPPFAN
jgi:hypothetical protein